MITFKSMKLLSTFTPRVVLIVALFVQSGRVMAQVHNGDSYSNTSSNKWVRRGFVTYKNDLSPYSPNQPVSIQSTSTHTQEEWTTEGEKVMGSDHTGIKFHSTYSIGDAMYKEAQYKITYTMYGYATIYLSPIDAAQNKHVKAAAGGRIACYPDNGTEVETFGAEAHDLASRFSLAFGSISKGMITLPSISFTPNEFGSSAVYAFSKPRTKSVTKRVFSQPYVKVSPTADVDLFRPIVGQVNSYVDIPSWRSTAHAVASLSWSLNNSYPQNDQSYQRSNDLSSAFVFGNP